MQTTVAIPAVSSRSSRLSVSDKAEAYLALTKPRIIELLLITTVPMMVVAARGIPDLQLVALTLVGGTLAAGGANAINMYVDRDIDAVMKRTARRPLVTGVIAPRNALAFAASLELIAAIVLWEFVNPLSSILALSATAFYVCVYTVWLKRSSPNNIVIGGAAGAVPVLIGWSAVTNTLGWAPLFGFLIIFLWTPPHFWALAVRYKDDYASVDVPMLPVVSSFDSTTKQMVWYAGGTWIASIGFAIVARMGVIYWVTATISGALFTRATVSLQDDRGPQRAMRVFAFSITYVTVLFAAMALDQVVVGR